MKQILETDRLIIRELNSHDAEFILKLVNTPAWLKFIGDRGVKNLDDAKKYIENGPVKSYADNGFGLYLMELKNEKAPIGMCGLIKRDFLPDPDIGFALMPEFEGKGYGYESASAVLSYGQRQLGLAKIVAVTVRENVNSIHLLEKIGLREEGTVVYPGTDEELLLFGVEFNGQGK
ncbi:GNAT family N-acetyltransferase [bacterium]|nr:MAG: GNAT family N-acetyltransferase [bacterium]